jgi:hypothetical protein
MRLDLIFEGFSPSLTHLDGCRQSWTRRLDW